MIERVFLVNKSLPPEAVEAAEVASSGGRGVKVSQLWKEFDRKVHFSFCKNFGNKRSFISLRVFSKIAPKYKLFYLLEQLWVIVVS